ncbi:hypothetical protein D3C85_1594570 [compost metagenome]
MPKPGPLLVVIGLKAIDNFLRQLKPFAVFIPGKPGIGADPQTQLLDRERRDKGHLA